MTQVFCKELAKSDYKSSKPELCGGLQDLLSRDTIPELFSTSSLKKGGGKIDCARWNKGDTKKIDSFSGKQTRAICKLNFHSSEEILKFWLVISLNNLNSYVEYNQFKMEILFVLNELLGRGIISAN